LSQNRAQNQTNDINDGNDDSLHTFDQKVRGQGTLSGCIPILADHSDVIENDNSKRHVYENSMATKRISQELIADKSHEFASEHDNKSGSEKEHTKFHICQNCFEVDGI